MSIVNNLSRPSESRASFYNFTSKEIASALRTVVAFTITDVFDLTPEESLWTSYHINEIIKPFENMYPRTIPISVSQELSTREYSNRLQRRENGKYNSEHNASTHAELEDWVDVFMDMIAGSYHPLRPMLEATVRGQITGMLYELGIGKVENARTAIYLPNAVRYALNAKKRENLENDI